MIAFGSFAAVASASVRLGRRELHIGMKGSDVKLLQQDLTKVGIRTKASGTFTKGTRSSVEKFQREHHLSVDGIVGPQTVGELKTVLKDEGSAKASSSNPPSNGGVGVSNPAPAPAPATTAVPKLKLNSKGLVVIPSGIPKAMAKALAAANKIAHDKYVYGGGHNGWGKQSGYDCSGSVSYVLHAAGLMTKADGDSWDEPFDSTQFESYGAKGKSNKWITLWANSGHAYMKISNLYFDTAAQSRSNGNDRWTTTRISAASGFVVRHPKGW